MESKARQAATQAVFSLIHICILDSLILPNHSKWTFFIALFAMRIPVAFAFTLNPIEAIAWQVLIAPCLIWRPPSLIFLIALWIMEGIAILSIAGRDGRVEG